MANNKKMGPPGMNKGGEKPKNFKQAISRLFTELSSFKLLIYISLLLAVLGSILSIMSPNKLSKLTDTIAEGLVINKGNLEELTKEITSNMSEDAMNKKVSDIIKININEEVIYNITTNNNITSTDKLTFRKYLQEINNDNQKTITLLPNLPDSILNIILPDTTYKEVNITTSDKIEFLKILPKMQSNTKEEISIPESIGKVLFEEVTIDNVKISSLDQTKFLSIIKSIDKDNTNANTLYNKIDTLPKNIKKLIEPTMNMTKIKNISIFLLMLYLCSALFTYIESISMTIVSNKFAMNLRTRISKKINKLPLKYFDKFTTGDILSRVTNDIDTIAQSMNQSLATLVSALTLFIGTIIMMFITNWIMAITAILSSLFGFIFMSLVLSKSQKYFTARQVELGNLNGHIEEVYSGLNVVKVYNGKKEADKKFDLYNKKVMEANRKSQFLSGLMMPMMGFIGNFGYVCVCIVGAILTKNNTISFGVIVAFITYVRLFTSPLSQIAQAMTSLQTTASASERVFEFLDEEEMDKEKEITKKLTKKEAKGNIEFKNVCFTYDGNDKPTIENFTAKISKGQKVAIVGPTGAGKTTMVNLLMKFYNINSGDIIIDGINTKELTRENIHSLFTMVLQDTWLFDGTIRENIVYNRKNISDKKIMKICEEIGLDHFIKTLSHGLDTKLSENESISAGQKQLLTIARVLLEDSPFLILDEATSNVDTRTEEIVSSAMDKLTEGKTSFIIAHRLSTIKNADLILVMKDGNIIETGNHKELMNQKGFYADLYNSQFEL